MPRAYACARVFRGVSDPTAPTRIGQIALTVDDLDRAVAYYRDVLRLKHLFSAGNMAFFDCGGTRLLVGTENPHAQKTFLYFEVADIHAAHDAMQQRGATFEERPHVIAKLPDREVWIALFKDPSGTMHHLISEVPTK